MNEIQEPEEKLNSVKSVTNLDKTSKRSFGDIFKAVSAIGVIFAAFSVGIIVESRFHVKSEQLSEIRNKLDKKESEISLLKQEIDKKQNQLNQKPNEIIQLQNIINKKEGEIDTYKKSLNSKVIENDQLKNKLSKIEIQNKQLTQPGYYKPKPNITSSIPPSEQNDQKIIKHDKIAPHPTPTIQNEEDELATFKSKMAKTGFPVEILNEHSTSGIIDGSFFITVNYKSRSAVNAVIRARGYPDVNIENGQAGQDYIFRGTKTYEIRILDIGVNSNVVRFFVRQIE